MDSGSQRFDRVGLEPLSRPSGETMASNDEQARALTEAMLEAGREPMWIVLVVGWYFGSSGRSVALEVIEEQAGMEPLA
jgi:hypothetical protein